ncbi:hypothetical protein [Lacicoccus alkaliphilus]|uniref:Uncharacterized protein n=1 Tax=Lacicoccus alkaliphilus DSM 16010 TaxID=1123231 RepID=A0A1M7I4S6_9BACL|nr:hypothetical protein [Salinicoccus alkaliphilus]SHM35792.1 hypothetical protein SAMN02745189_02032 [Salinicoccus alkaliphilus DSM 16010]
MPAEAHGARGRPFLKTAALFHLYFISFYLLMLIIFSRFTVSALLLLIPLLILGMVPLMERGLKAHKEKSVQREFFPAIGFLTLFVSAKVIMLGSLHASMSAFYIVDLEASVINMLLVGTFTLALALSIYFFFTAESWTGRFIFVILGVYSAARILHPFAVIPGITGWILQYMTLAALPVILAALFIRAKRGGDSE